MGSEMCIRDSPMIIQLAEGNGGEPYADGRILAMTPLADKQEETFIEFTAPSKPGRYLYVCTYIAHAGSMRGYMIVEWYKNSIYIPSL